METKVRQKLKRWLCKLLGCDVTASKTTPVVHKAGDLETFQYDGYDVEVYLFPETQSLKIQVYLKGSCVLSGDCRVKTPVEWIYGAHYPSYRTRKYIQDYAEKRLTKLKDST